MKNSINLKLCKTMIMEVIDGKKVYTVDAIDYCVEDENGYALLLTGDFAGEYLPNYDDKIVTDGIICVSVEDLEKLKLVIPTNDIDEIRQVLQDLLIDRKYVFNEDIKNLKPLNEYYIIKEDENIQEKEEKKANKKENNKNVLKSVDQIDYDIRKSIIGQDSAIKKIVAAVYGNQKIFNSDFTKEQKVQLKRNVLIVGKTGTGKTEIIKQLAKHLNIPYVIEDATRYTKAGYVGESVEDMLKNLVKRANDDISKAERGILVVDEIDKKRSNNSRGDVGTEDVQFSLLKIIEGGVFNISDSYGFNTFMFDTSMLTVIFSGAFTEMYNDNSNLNRKVGFGNDNEYIIPTKEFVPEDFVKYGMVPELMGRISTIVQMNNLTLEDYKTIIKKSKLSPIVLKRMFLKSQNVDLRVEDAFITFVAEEAMKLGMGARGIKIVFDKLLGDIDFDVLQGNLKQIKLTKDQVVRVRHKKEKNN